MARLAAISLVVSLCHVPAAQAQARLTGADLQGSVLDASAGALPGATVQVTNLDTNLRRATETDPKGRYAVAALAPGSYRITVELSGFVKQTRQPVALQLGQTATLDFTLTVAGSEEQVTVTAEAPIVDLAQTAVASVVGQQQIDALPINGRNFIAFSVVTPGVTTDRTPQQGA